MKEGFSVTPERKEVVSIFESILALAQEALNDLQDESVSCAATLQTVVSLRQDVDIAFHRVMKAIEIES